MEVRIYETISDDSRLSYEFFSEGQNGRIRKIVQYQKMMDNIYNLTFGDWNVYHQKIDDKTISNNNDREKVLFTVASTVIIFLTYYPGTAVYFEGSTPSRTRLYQMGINANLHIISPRFNILGISNNISEPFKAGKNYEAFLIFYL